MRGFSQAPEGEIVTFTRGSETISITFYPLPMGYHNYLAKSFPVPRHYSSGKAVAAPAGEVNEWNDLATILLVARSAEDGTFSTKLPGDNSAPDFWRARAVALLAELRAAQFNDADLAYMWQIVKRISNASSVSQRLDVASKNS